MCAQPCDLLGIRRMRKLLREGGKAPERRVVLFVSGRLRWLARSAFHGRPLVVLEQPAGFLASMIFVLATLQNTHALDALLVLLEAQLLDVGRQ